MAVYCSMHLLVCTFMPGVYYSTPNFLMLVPEDRESEREKRERERERERESEGEETEKQHTNNHKMYMLFFR